MRKENGSESLGFSSLSCKSLGQISCFPNLNMNGKMGAGVLELFSLAGQTPGFLSQQQSQNVWKANLSCSPPVYLMTHQDTNEN